MTVLDQLAAEDDFSILNEDEVARSSVVWHRLAIGIDSHASFTSPPLYAGLPPFFRFTRTPLSNDLSVPYPSAIAVSPRFVWCLTACAANGTKAKPVMRFRLMAMPATGRRHYFWHSRKSPSSNRLCPISMLCPFSWHSAQKVTPQVLAGCRGSLIPLAIAFPVGSFPASTLPSRA